LNKSKIEWCDYTWNPVTGCLHACDFCYARRIDKRFGDGKFEPTFHPERLQQPLKVKKPSRIFVGSVSDLFGDWEWKVSEIYLPRNYVVEEILDVVKQCPQHTFIFLTKNPKGMQGFDFPDNCWCGTSVENQEKADERRPELLKVNCKTLFVSYEPALGPINFDSYYWDYYDQGVKRTLNKINWLIIGAQTGPGAVKPNAEWIDNAISQCMEANVPVFVKDNVGYPEQIRQYPGVIKI
jgi:protein gp37